MIYWVGAAAGFETFNLGATNGAWADLELGMDMRGTIPIGMTLTVGGGLDAAAPEPTAGPLHATMALLVRFPFQV